VRWVTRSIHLLWGVLAENGLKQKITFKNINWVHGERNQSRGEQKKEKKERKISSEFLMLYMGAGGG